MASVIHQPHELRRKRWTIEEYTRLSSLDVISSDVRLELLEGEIIEKIGQDLPHITGIRAMSAALRQVFGKGFDVNAQLPISTPDSVPEPDLLVLKGSWKDFVDRHPTQSEVALVVEVSSSSRLQNDCGLKARIYANAGFEEYWILNLVNRGLEVHRRPQADGSYGDVRYYFESDSVSPLAAPSESVLICDLFPPALFPPADVSEDCEPLK